MVGRLISVLFISLFIGLVGKAYGGKAITKEQLSKTSIKVAAVQMTGQWIYPQEYSPETTDQVVGYIDRAGKDGVDLIVFPELLLGKFKVPNAETDKISKAAKRNNVNVIVGCFEIFNKKGEYGNSSLVFDRKGEIIGRYYKMHQAVGFGPYCWPPTPDDPEWLMTPGDDVPVFDLDFGRIGILTCYDGYFPELFRILSLKGAELLIWPNARGGAVEDYIVKTAMSQNYVNMICTNKAIGAGTMIAEWPTNIKAITTEPQEEYLVADISMQNVRYGRKYSRGFFQRAPKKYKEILGNYQIWKDYEELDDVPGAPAATWAKIAKTGKVSDKIELTPVIVNETEHRAEGMREGKDLSRIAFRMRPAWMAGSVELRFPEVLSSSMGFHFLDNYSSSIIPLSEFENFPEWKYDERKNSLSYEYTTKEGLRFGGKAIGGADEVELELFVKNETGKELDFVEWQVCLDLGHSDQFEKKWDLNKLFAVYNGKYQPLVNTTPTPEQVGRDPWLVMLTQSGKDTFGGPKDSGLWWRTDQVADENIMAAESKYGRFLVAFTWADESKNLMSNCGNPCLHAGPGAKLNIKPGETRKWKGKVYFMENDPKKLLDKYQADKLKWK